MKTIKANEETEMKTELTRDDILDMDAYNAVRDERRPAILETKRKRRLQVGPHATFYFECFDTMWYQIQEMLRIEKGGEEQLADELEAYSPLVPKGDELVATVMFEIPDADQRARILGGLGGVEETITLDIGDESIAAEAEQDMDRTSAAGKASSVQCVPKDTWHQPDFSGQFLISPTVPGSSRATAEADASASPLSVRVCPVTAIIRRLLSML